MLMSLVVDLIVQTYKSVRYCEENAGANSLQLSTTTTIDVTILITTTGSPTNYCAGIIVDVQNAINSIN